jgi:hypothetical protein
VIESADHCCLKIDPKPHNSLAWVYF